MLLPDGQLASLHQGGEFFLLTDYVAGTLYADDLARLRDTGRRTARDLQRAERLARYLAAIHSVTRADPAWYNVADAVRLALFRFIDTVLAAPVFDPAQVNTYLQR